jgi:hypothetical protein
MQASFSNTSAQVTTVSAQLGPHLGRVEVVRAEAILRPKWAANWGCKMMFNIIFSFLIFY